MLVVAVPLGIRLASGASLSLSICLSSCRSVLTRRRTLFTRHCVLRFTNSIAFGSAPRERLTVSQSVPSQASRQSDRNTQFGFFVSGRCGTKQQGGFASKTKQWPSGNAAGQSAFGRRFEPRSGEFGAAAAAAAAKSRPTRTRTTDQKLYVSCVTPPPPPLAQARPRSEKQRSHGVPVLGQARACARRARQRDTAHRKPARTPHQAHHSQTWH